MPAASSCCNARIHSSSLVSSASSADTVAAFAVERESLIRVSLALIASAATCELKAESYLAPPTDLFSM
jgi:hypothetical protein